MKKYRVVSLFSGAMGLDLGLEQTGRFEVAACVEIEKSICDTIRANQKAGRLSSNLVVIHADIAKLPVAELLARSGIDPTTIDLLVGGPPCQSFSTAGRRQSVGDPRGTLLWDFIRFIEGLNPKFFLMENVRGLLSAALKHRPIAERPALGGKNLLSEEEQGSVVQLFAHDLINISGGPYHMDCFEVNAVNYGAPQLRERALFIGNRFGSRVNFPEPTHGIEEVNDDLFVERKARLPWKTLGEAIGGLTDAGDVVMDFSPRKKHFLSMVPPGANWRSLPLEAQKESMGRAWLAKGGRSGWWRRLTMDLPCPTLVTMPNHASTSLCHPTETRALTIREYARIQEFPDDWEICGRTSEQYAQIGNAVPLRLGEVVGNIIADELDLLKARQWTRNTSEPNSFRTFYVQAHIRTRQWYKAGETFVWTDGSDNSDLTYGASKTKRKIRHLVGKSLG